MLPDAERLRRARSLLLSRTPHTTRNCAFPQVLLTHKTSQCLNKVHLHCAPKNHRDRLPSLLFHSVRSAAWRSSVQAPYVVDDPWVLELDTLALPSSVTSLLNITLLCPQEEMHVGITRTA